MVDYQRRVELIQDLWFETATTKIKVTPDGEFLIASGALQLILWFIYLFFAYECISLSSCQFTMEMQVYIHLKSKYMSLGNYR